MATHTYRLNKNLTGRSSRYLEEALYVRLFRNGNSPKSVNEELKTFIKSSKRVYKWEVADAIRKLRQRKWFKYALRLSEVMVKRKLVKTVGDHAMHLDLVAKVRGIAAAETYFIDLHESSKKHLCYGTLLHCYCKEMMTEKAEGVLEKMKELNLSLTPMPYNSLMTLYTRIGRPELIPVLVQEMKASNVTLDTFTYNIWMRALASLDDIPGVDRVASELRADPLAEADWTTYSNLASIYATAGMNQKAEAALRDLEKKNKKYRHHSPFQFLITLYGKTGNTGEVYRVWRSLKQAFPDDTTNISFLNVIQVLVKLKDVAGAEKCFNEWESGCSRYDVRIPNVLMAAFLGGGEVEKAEALRRRAMRRGNPNAKTWEIFHDHHLRHGDDESAIYCLKKAAEAAAMGEKKWAPCPATVEKLMKHFEEKKDVQGAEDFLKCLKKPGDATFSLGVYESLLRIHVAAGKRSKFMRHRLKMEKVEFGEENKGLLDAVCLT